jgi:hypothetical protein
MPLQTSVSGDSVMATLECERQAIFNTNISEAERYRQWSRRKSEIEAFLAADASASPAHTRAPHSRSLVTTASHVGYPSGLLWSRGSPSLS